MMMNEDGIKTRLEWQKVYRGIQLDVPHFCTFEPVSQQIGLPIYIPRSTIFSTFWPIFRCFFFSRNSHKISRVQIIKSELSNIGGTPMTPFPKLKHHLPTVTNSFTMLMELYTLHMKSMPLTRETMSKENNDFSQKCHIPFNRPNSNLTPVG